MENKEPTMKKYIYIILFSLSALILTGCGEDGIPPPDSVRLECKPDGPPKEQCKIIVEWTFSSPPSSSYANLINETLYIYFGSGNRLPWDLTGNLTTLTLKNNHQFVAATSAQSQLSGDKIIPGDQASLSNWLSNYDGLADEIVLEIDGIDFNFENGSNTIVAEVVHDGNVLAGTTYSQYNSPPPGYWDEK